MKNIHPVYVLVTAYFLVAILTYGHAYNNINSNSGSKEFHVAEKIAGSFLCGAVFPLYWATFIFESKEKK